ncbi:unnamed protein product, partial [Mesorhabditis belari]|uniref:Elongation of very long chain fatty acids protein n=1 Tax=Mesorhabditis belari TaxID=2138241 RepID=A0AAF3J8Z7_9BILA
MTYLTTWTSLHPEILYVIILAYLIVVFYLPVHVRRKHNFMPYWYRLHGLISLFLLIMLIPEMIRILIRGWSWAVCDRDTFFTAPLSGWAVNLFFFSKFLDLAETVLIVLDDRRPLPIHLLHHFSTLYFVWKSIAGEVALLRPLVTVNLAAHVLLFSYLTPHKFFHIRPCYTSVALSQMAQFVVCLFGCLRAHSVISSGKECHITRPWLQITTAGVLGFLFLFADFYHQKYVKFRRERACLGKHSSRERVNKQAHELRSVDKVSSPLHPSL